MNCSAPFVFAVATILWLGGCASKTYPDGALPEAAGGAAVGSAEIARGQASWYGEKFHGRRTANGERFDMNALTAAHPTLPFGTRVRVRSAKDGREVVVRINDRGPHVKGRIIDLSYAAAMAIGLVQAGSGPVVLTTP